MIDRCSKGAFNAPSIGVDSRYNRTRAYSCVPTPLCKRLYLSVMFYIAVISFVIGLLIMGSPSAIVWLVIPIIIYTIKRVSLCGFRSHIRKEELKGLPPLTNRNSSSAVGFIRGHIRIRASSYHAMPRGVFGRVPHSVRCSALTNRLPHIVRDFGASTRFYNTSYDLSHTQCRRVSTFAKEVPFSGGFTRSTEYSKFIKTLAGHFFFIISLHNSDYNIKRVLI